MIKRSPSRNQRSRGIKVKHVLQITLLLGVCFWLIYQVKHSHDKKKEFDENDTEVSVGTQTSKLGRKDLRLGKDEVNQNEKPDEEEEDENVVEDDEDKHEHSEHEGGNEHESVEKDDKHGVRGGGDEQEVDERGGGDDEIDENDQEQSAVDTDHDEEFMDEDKGREEESDEKDKENIKDEEKDGSVTNHNSHEAREENYNGDDASSAVSHDTGTISTETEALSLENSDVNLEMNITKSVNRSNYSKESNKNQHSSNFNITEAVLPGEPSSNATSGKETGSNGLSNIVDSSHLENITTTFSGSHSEAGSNLTVVIPGGSNNWTGTSANNSSEPNKMVMFSESNQAQNGTVNTTLTGDVKNVQTEGLEQGGNMLSEENLLGLNLTVPAETEKRDVAAGESSNLEGGELEKTRRFVAPKETENSGNTESSETNKTQNISYMNENIDATKDEIKGDPATDETSDSVEHRDFDSLDSHILKNVAEVRTDLDTLPDIRNEGDNGDATATD
ncbi:myb-like protein X [Cajanus cajan]|uniref:myb-like protein X n=1 Tax=Cajanus cajan TaxID=3821 RepID=UPI00098D968D|nr:myb-like protein X [Cajanus cajan]XP_020217950.1 myb-like protein X [Cajanus cajan]XP_029127688.1 myb-like protein X [Cajanus cajan]